MALVFDDRNLLPSGVYFVSLEIVEEYFAKFQKTDRRIRLFEKLRAYLDEIKRAGCGISVIVNGSFVMPCVDDHEDIDLILILPPNWDMAADLKPYQYNLVSKKQVKKVYGIEVFPVRPDSLEEQKWIEFFTKVNIKWCQKFGWPADSEKGIVKVVL